MKKAPRFLSFLRNQRLATIPLSIALLIGQTFHAELVQAQQLSVRHSIPVALPSITLPPETPEQAPLDPDGAYCVTLDDSTNHSNVSPERQQEVMDQAREEQYFFYPKLDSPGDFRASNPDHNFSFVHSAAGLTITPRPEAHQLLQPDYAPAWSVHYQSTSLVLDGEPTPLNPTPPSSFENQSSADRLPGCNEWFINGSEGLQHGFTIQEPKEVQPRSLAVRIKVLSSLTPHFDARSEAVEFRDSSGMTLLGYRDLHVFDRTGRALPSAMTLDTSGEFPTITLQANVQDAEFPITVDPFTYAQQGANRMPSDTVPGDGFGSTSAGKGDYTAIGAALKGNGAVYVYHRNEGGADNWGQVDKLEVPAAQNPGETDQFGSSLVFTEDEETGNQYLLVGAQQHNGCGSVFVYLLVGIVWTFLQRIQPNDLTLGAYFGCSLAAAGTLIAIGALAQAGKGAVYLFTLAAALFTFFQIITDSEGSLGDDFGFAVALTATLLIVGAPGYLSEDGEHSRAGAALAFTALAAGALFSLFYTRFYNPDPAPNQNMGTSVAIFLTTIFIGIPGARKAVAWRLTGLLWTQIAFFFGPSNSLFGAFMTTNAFGDLAISAPNAGTYGKIFLFLFNSITQSYPRSGEEIEPTGGDPGMQFGLSFILLGRLLFAMAPNYFSGMGAFFLFLLTATLLTFTGFQSLYFTPEQLADPTKEFLFGFFGDYDGDGLRNFIEFLFGTNPTVFDRSPLSPITGNGLFQILLPLSLIALNANLFIEYSLSLNFASWFVIGTGLLATAFTSRIVSYGIARQVLLLTVSLPLALAIDPRFFLRYRGEQT